MAAVFAAANVGLGTLGFGPRSAVAAPLNTTSCSVPATTLSPTDQEQIRVERETHLASTFRRDSLYLTLLADDGYQIPSDLSGLSHDPVPISSLPELGFYGNRVHPIYGYVRFHNGIDVVQPTGEPVVAIADGTVVLVGSTGGYGNAVVVDHGGGLSTLSAHLSAFDVAVGDVVVAGQVIGRVGRTGLATGPHLHFETRLGGVPVDPHWFLPALDHPSRWIPPHDEASFQIQRLYVQAFGRLPDDEALVFWVDQCRAGRSLADVANSLASGQEFSSRNGAVDAIGVRALVDAAQSDEFVDAIGPELIDPAIRRLYIAVLGREPDSSGGYYWTARARGGEPLVSLAELIGNSPEYEARFGVSQTEEFVERTYQLVFGRAPDDEGLRFWTARAEETSRWNVLVGFAESIEGQALLGS